MITERLTTAQAIIRFLDQQYVERDGIETKFFAGCFGIFGHGNVAGIGQALHQYPQFTYYQSRTEQGMVHTAAAYAKTKKRLSIFACTSSIGPGATNMITAAAAATINRIPALLLVGDYITSRSANPLLQQLEHPNSPDVSVNDCFKPISKFWDRIHRPEQIIQSLTAAMQILTSPSDTGTVTLCLPHDVQTEAYEYPIALFEKRTWHIPRNRPDPSALLRAAEMIKKAKKPVIISGGGVLYSDAEVQLNTFSRRTGIPIGETYAGKGAVRYDAEYGLGGLGINGTKAAVEIANEADLVIGIGTRYTDFTTASNSLFKNPAVNFININVCASDAHKLSGLALQGDARATIVELQSLLSDYAVSVQYRDKIKQVRKDWDKEVKCLYANANENINPIDQLVLIGTLNDFMNDDDVVVNAAGSMPGDLHKLWRTTNPYNFHIEYGYSCMGYEIAGGLGVKMAAPNREVYVLCGDGSYLMLHSEIITSIQEGYKIIIVLSNNNGFASIGSFSESVGNERFGTNYRYRDKRSGQLTGNILPVDLAKNAESLGAIVFSATDKVSLVEALNKAKQTDRTTLVYIETDLHQTVSNYNTWWDVPVAEISTQSTVNQSREEYERQKSEQQRHYL